MTDRNKNIRGFIDRWKGRGDEKQDTQKFWIDLLHSVFAFDDPVQLIDFEKRVKLEDSTRFIDAYIPQTKVIIESSRRARELIFPKLKYSQVEMH